jgi:hypothetical protein
MSWIEPHDVFSPEDGHAVLDDEITARASILEYRSADDDPLIRFQAYFERHGISPKLF